MIKWIKNLLKKSNNMEEQIEAINQDLIRAKEDLQGFSFKWLKGEQKGSITDLQDVIFDETTGIVWVYFIDGSRINYSIIDEFMLRLDGSEAREIRERELNPSREKETSRRSRNIQLIDDTPGNSQYKIDSPIRSLLQKQKPNWVDVNFKLKLNLPPKSLYDVLNSSFEDAEKEIINFVVEDMDLELIKEALRKNIREIYKKNADNRQSIQEDDSQ